ncbi:MAG: ATP-binding protein [Thermodesulfobacteriota bacterium]
MKSLLSLRTRILLPLGLLVLANILGAAVTLWYVQETNKLYDSVVDRDVDALIAAERLETDLVAQKGYVTYYFLKQDPEFLTQLTERNAEFKKQLHQAQTLAYLPQASDILNQISLAYDRYAAARDRVIDLYKEGELAKGAALHWGVRDQFHAIYSLCEQSIAKTRDAYRRRVQYLKATALAAIPATTLLGFLLAFILFRQVLVPVRRLAEKTQAAHPEKVQKNEIAALGKGVASLMEDVDKSLIQLEESRGALVQAEKLAMVGKLSAGVAHSIRNPLTSVKMRLFSLERTLALDQMQKEDFEVIAEEIRHLDTIISNFLEFARPPRLRMQMVSPSDVTDMALLLLRHRVESYGVEVRVNRSGLLPKVLLDPEQLKEVLVNLFFNSCEAMGEGGTIEITEEDCVTDKLGRAAVIRFSDTGPGIAPELREKVFEPFFSTKEEGTGLGLAIARRIIEEHGGFLTVGEAVIGGVQFIIALPIKEAGAAAGNPPGK